LSHTSVLNSQYYSRINYVCQYLFWIFSVFLSLDFF